MNETWAQHPEYDKYEISDQGRVLSWHRVGFGNPSVEPHILTPWADTNGYLNVTIVHNGERHRCGVHRLVLETFVGKAPKGQEACHYDGNRTNNRLNNLRWDTRKNNALDKNRHGTQRRGGLNGNAKLTDEQVIEIRKWRSEGALYREIAEKYGVTKSNAFCVCTGKSFSHLPNIQPKVLGPRKAKEPTDA